MTFTTAGVVLLRTSGKGRSVVAARDFDEGEVVEASPVIPFPGDQGPAFESTVLSHHPYRWVRTDGPPSETSGPSLNHWSLAGREDGAIVLGFGTFINHSYRPNCRYERDFADARLDFVALKPIKRGDEITVNYNGDPDGDEEMWFDVAPDVALNSDLDSLVTPTVRTRVGTSPGRGRGVFATGDIAIGDVIERAPVIVLPQRDYDLLDENTVLSDHHYPWNRTEGSGALVLGNGSIYNHSFEPNADYVRDLDAEEIVLFATRPIADGEEIRWNYRNGWSSGGPLWFPASDD